MSQRVDLKALSLQLYQKIVLVKIKFDTENWRKMNHSIEGTLIGRLWGERVIADNKIETTVIGITIRTKEGEEHEILCSDIKSLTEVN